MWIQGFADFTDATVLEVEEATKVKKGGAKKGGQNKLPPKRKGAGEINTNADLADDPSKHLALNLSQMSAPVLARLWARRIVQFPRKRPRHKDAEKDVARIAALRSRRSAVDQTVGSSVRECKRACGTGGVFMMQPMPQNLWFGLVQCVVGWGC